MTEPWLRNNLFVSPITMSKEKLSIIEGVSPEEWATLKGQARCSMFEIDTGADLLVWKIHPLQGLHAIVSKFNHSCDANAVYCFIDDNFQRDQPTTFVYANRDIEAGEEIFIRYGVSHGHEKEDETGDYSFWECKCGKNYEERLEQMCDQESVAERFNDQSE